MCSPTGCLLAIARQRALHNDSILSHNHFWQTFWFMLATIAIVITTTGMMTNGGANKR